MSEPQTDAWDLHLTLIASYTPQTINYPKIAMARIPVDIEPADWTDNSDGTVSATVSHENIFKEMSLIEWEPDDGYDFSEQGDYETFDGSIVFTLPETPTTKISGYVTVGVDSAQVDASVLPASVVTSVNGKAGDVVIPVGVESIDGLSYTIAPSAWISGTFTYADGESGSCYYYETDCVGTKAGDRFVATFSTGNAVALYVTPLEDKLYLETAEQPSGSVVIKGYIRKEGTR